ncbi:MAG: hypothetical protein A2Z88_02190 [Omnitrophica WOR_2 bacterium GWA2_47_8]|nr:MAG: hypothetical protein A2Z88_02190 [Omnitrophica WOR_2 bacterium GWA2_47_8]
MIDPSRWLNLSFAQQMGNIGSEIARARHWEKQNDAVSRDKALERALELLDLSLASTKTMPQLKEVARLREVVAAWYARQKDYDIDKTALEDYCINFSFL